MVAVSSDHGVDLFTEAESEALDHIDETISDTFETKAGPSSGKGDAALDDVLDTAILSDEGLSPALTPDARNITRLARVTARRSKVTATKEQGTF